ncbi:MAG: phasin family protein [Acidobacteriota bacterium]|nr:MAG: phasin family protein [Acidobacteriota bacterium]
MLDILRKTYLAGLGLAMVTREKLEEAVDELVAKGEVAEKDRKQVIDDLVAKARDETDRFKHAVKENVSNVISEMRMPSRQMFQDLAARVEALEKKAGAAAAKPKDDSTPKNR